MANAGNTTSRRSGKPLKIAGFCLLGVLLLAVACLVWFGAWRYPAYGLSDVPRRDYRRALEIAAKGIARSEGLMFEDFAFLKFREVERGSEAYAWGAARCLDENGGTEYAWVYLEWSRRRGQWLRNYSLVLAGPGEEMYFTRTHPGQLRRALLALEKILHMNRAHIREVLEND